MNIPPFLDVWSVSRRKRFYLFESQKLIFEGANIYSVGLSKKVSQTSLSIEYENNILKVSTKDIIAAPIFLAGSRVKALTISKPTFFTFMGYEIFADNIKSYEEDFWFTGCLTSAVKDHLVYSRRPGVIFLIGDTGTGKELLAKNMHYNSSRRHNPFVAINCASLESGTAEKELFGNVKGAFTNGSTPTKGFFINAGAGTVFLDSIEDLPMNVQPMLLRAIELNEVRPSGADVNREHKARVMASSSLAPKELLYRGLIRKDLYYRLEECCVYMPELREIRNEIKDLIYFYVGPEFKLQDGVINMLENYDWPGNIREFRSAIERAKVLALKDGVIKREYFNMNNRFDFKSERIKDPSRIYPLENEERDSLLDTLNKNKWNIVDTAKDLNICKITLLAKIEHYGLRDQN